MNFVFSYKQEIYEEKTEGMRRYLNWKNQEKKWKYKDCHITVIGMSDNKARIVIRRKHQGYSNHRKSDFSVNLMMGFVIYDAKKITDDEIEFAVQQSSDGHHRDLKDVHIKSENIRDIRDLYNEIKQKQGNSPDISKIIKPYNVDTSNQFIPVIYQPRIDAWKNFLREIHVKKHDNGNHEITLVFNDESLRKHGFLDFLYRIFRSYRYGRTIDIESFEEKSCKFYFTNIYSGKNTLFDDTIHNEAEVEIKYYFIDEMHPIVFVNTSNHALAPHDNNHDFWKWEYVAWDTESPVRLGNMTRKQIEQNF